MKLWLRKRREDQQEEDGQFAVAVLVFSPAGVPLVRDFSKGLITYWKFPGGKGKPGETPQEAAVREVFEETGIRLNPGGLRLLRKEKKRTHDSFVFRINLVENPSAISDVGDEGEEVRVFSRKDFWRIPDLLPQHRNALAMIFRPAQ